MPAKEQLEERSRAEIEELRARLDEAEETLRAIRSGEVDAVVIEGKAGPQIYTLESAEAVSNRFRGEVLAQINDAVIAVDNEQRIIYFNGAAERQYGISASQVLGDKLAMVYRQRWLSPEDESAAVRILKETGCWRGENIHIKNSGEEIHVESTVSQLHDLKGVPGGLLAVIRDVTGRKRVEMGLAKAQAELQQHAETLENAVADRTARLKETIGELEAFSYSMAHDLRAPLRAMNSFGQLLSEGYAERLDEAGKDYLQRICMGAARLDLLIRDVLNYSRLLHSPTILSNVDLDQLVRGILRTYPDLQASEATIKIQAPLPQVIGHEGFLTQCISNLLSNAVKFVANGVHPHVKIWAEPKDGFVRINFQDNGIGIAPQKRERIFWMFERGHPEGHYEGTGMGLTIVKKAVERIGGKIGYESEPGRGSKFWIELHPVEVTKS